MRGAGTSAAVRAGPTASGDHGHPARRRDVEYGGQLIRKIDPGTAVAHRRRSRTLRRLWGCWRRSKPACHFFLLPRLAFRRKLKDSAQLKKRGRTIELDRNGRKGFDRNGAYERGRPGAATFTTSRVGARGIFPSGITARARSPEKDPARSIDLKQLVDTLVLRRHQPADPIRFADILKHRLGEIPLRRFRRRSRA